MMNENVANEMKKRIFSEVIGLDEIQSENSRRIIMNNFDEFNNNFNIMTSIYEDDVEALKYIKIAYIFIAH